MREQREQMAHCSKCCFLLLSTKGALLRDWKQREKGSTKIRVTNEGPKIWEIARFFDNTFSLLSYAVSDREKRGMEEEEEARQVKEEG